MKKILTLFLAGTLGCFAQTPVEGFEDVVFPPDGWNTYDNGVGPIKFWQQTIEANPFTPPYEGNYAAFIDRENVPNVYGTAQDWLVTPYMTVTGNSPAIHFYSRLTLNGDQGSIYRIMMSTNPDSSNLGDYTVVKEWTELEINPVQMEYREIYVPIPQEAIGQQVYFAFVMETDYGDRWLIDDVSFIEDYCEQPTNLDASVTIPNSATLSWTGVNQSLWEVEFLASNENSTGTGVLVSENSYTVTGLAAGNYKYYVRAVCSETNQSEWSGPYSFILYNGIDGVVSYDSDKDKECDSVLEGAEVILTVNEGEYVYTTYTDSLGYYSFYPLNFSTATVNVEVTAPEGFKEIDPVALSVDFNTQPDVSIDMCFDKVKKHLPDDVEVEVKSTNRLNDTQISIYPNPVTERLYFTSQNNGQPETVQVFDVNGKLCIEQNKPQGSVDVRKLQPGLYFIKLSTETETKNMKFIKQ